MIIEEDIRIYIYIYNFKLKQKIANINFSGFLLLQTRFYLLCRNDLIRVRKSRLEDLKFVQANELGFLFYIGKIIPSFVLFF